MNNNSNKLLTIIIPHYKSLDSLEKLLNSIPKNELYQVIVVDDHSSCDFQDISIKFFWVEFVSQVCGKKWAGAARNKGLSLAVGKFILFADADDYFVSNAFELVDEYIAKDFDIVYFSPTSINENGKLSLRHTKYSDLVVSYLNSEDNAIRYEYFVPWSKLYKAKLIQENDIKFDEVIASNDVMFSLMTGFYGNNFEVSSDTIYCVVESSSSLTKVLSEDVTDSRFDVLCRYNNFIKEKLCSGKQVSVISCISRARKISLYKMLSVLFFSLHKGYPILPNFSGFRRWFKRTFS
jgi:glycosyltransferase involved in cell wall biosynthesis